jgi:tetratricopeptide (TPR) repeat protein
MPDYLPALEGAAQIEYQQGGSGADALLRRVLALRPADPATHAMLAVVQYKSGNCKDAVVHFQQAQSVIRSQFVPVSEFGICLAKLDRFQEAIPVLQQAVALEPVGHHARYNLALVLWESKNYGEAITVLEPEMESSPNDEDTLTLAADIYEAKNETPRAVELLRKAIVANPLNTKAYLWFATVSNDHASYQVGIDMLNAGLRQIPQAAQLYLARGVLYAQLANFDKAMDDFEMANRLDPRLSFAGTAEGITETQKHDFDHGLAKFREQARLHPSNAFNQYLLAETLAQRGAPPGSPEYNEELYAAIRAVQLDPHLALAHNILVNLYLEAGKTALAIEQCEAVLQVDPANQEALYHLILALRKTDRKDEIPSLTKRLLALRSAVSDKESHTIRYQLVETAPASSRAGSGPN